MAMTMSIDFSPELEARLRARAEASGKGLAELVREAVEEKLRVPQTFAEVLAPIHEATRESGLDERELAQFIEECRDEAFTERHAKKRT